jgi:2-amino-4-hydroxy-6-hydroxymethyldihydropteridine diphosphokinase
MIKAALDRLQTWSDQPLRRSSLWRSDPVDCPPGSPRFLNAMAAMVPRAGETPERLLERLLALEGEFGQRPRRVPNEPRALDLDLIAYGNEVRATAQLILPHPRAHRRGFVLAPLNELAGALVLPGQTRSVRELVAAMGTQPGLTRMPSAR